MGEKKSCDVLLIMMLLTVDCVQKQSCTKLVNISQGRAMLNLIILHYVSVMTPAGIRQELSRKRFRYKLRTWNTKLICNSLLINCASGAGTSQ
ncbi:hypothetical protein KC19_8G140400 [Ceratodon purpureus]|uniref:Secreted protein n=1 Tax=Ceratodon purpureus TaxID=3225 RepID=A0A8T0H375_CERPU|nr:hypothetical protein KC19_8G140400 [Ceratodon purpureus]